MKCKCRTENGESLKLLSLVHWEKWEVFFYYLFLVLRGIGVEYVELSIPQPETEIVLWVHIEPVLLPPLLLLLRPSHHILHNLQSPWGLEPLSSLLVSPVLWGLGGDSGEGKNNISSFIHSNARKIIFFLNMLSKKSINYNIKI